MLPASSHRAALVLCRLSLLLLMLLPQLARAQGAMIPAPPSIGASAYVLVDAASGQTIAADNPDKTVEPASLTKIMTVYVAAAELAEGRLTLNEKLTVSEKAWKTEGSRMFIKVNSQVRVEDILQGIIVQSGNDASVALAEHIAGAEEVFASMMNRHAQELGMSGSHFANATGLPNEQTYTTARDMALLTRALVTRYPDIYARFRQQSFTWNNIKQPNRNRLLYRDDSVDGVKTGHTESAGYCLVSSAQRDDMRLIAVVLGTASDDARTEASRALLEYGFRFFESRPIYEAWQPIATQKLWKGRAKTLGYGFSEPVVLTLPRGRYGDVSVDVDLPEAMVAPVARGTTLGAARFMLDGEVLLERPLLATEDVPAAGFIGRTIDSLKMLVF